MELIFRQKLTRQPRAYQNLPSVTSILDVLEDPSYIRTWKEKAEDPSEVDKIMDNAKRRGSYVHLVASDYYTKSQLNYDGDSLAKYKERYGLPEYDAKVSTFLLGFNKFVAQEDVVPVSVEESLVHQELGFAGKPDLVGYFRNKLSILDWKTSSSARISSDLLFKYWIQLAAYAAMWNFKHLENKIEQLVIVPFTDARKTGLGEIEIIDIAPEIQSYFFLFIECLDKFKLLWPQSEYYPNFTELETDLMAAQLE